MNLKYKRFLMDIGFMLGSLCMLLVFVISNLIFILTKYVKFNLLVFIFLWFALMFILECINQLYYGAYKPEWDGEGEEAYFTRGKE